MTEALGIIVHFIAMLIALGALVLSMISMRQAKDTKNAEAAKDMFDKLNEEHNDLARRMGELHNEITNRMADHEKYDASTFSTIKARLHSHRALLRFLQTLPERTRVLEYVAKIKADTARSNEDFDHDTDEEDKL